MKASSSKQRFRIPFLLPIRRTRWQVIRVWLRQLWHRWRTPRIEVQPPLQPARHKPFPQRPHHRRRQAVFAALASAPPDATTQALIAHVRVVTGMGCSPKLIAVWKQEHRPGEGATTRRGEGGQKKWSALQWRLFWLLLAFGGTWPMGHLVRNVGAQEIVISPAPTPEAGSSNPKSQISPASEPRLLRIKLTLQSPKELRIQTGDNVNAGDVLSDHRSTRQQLRRQQRALQSAQQHLQTQMRLTNESLQQLQALGLELPPITFAAERAALQRAEAEAIAIHRAVEIQQQKVRVVGGQWPVVSNEFFAPDTASAEPDSSAIINRPPATDHRPLILEHETAKLTQAQDQQRLAHSDLELHKANFTTAQELRAGQEQTHRVEVTRQILNVRQQQQQLKIEGVRLAAQLTELAVQLANLTAIRAPFAGVIKRIEWEEMNDETLTVLVYLSLGNR